MKPYFISLLAASLREKDTWGLVQGQKPVKCKWIFQVERGSNGKTKEYKGLSIAAIFLKTWDGLQSNVCTKSHHTILLNSNADYICSTEQHANGNCDILNGTLDEYVYMIQPE